VTGEACEQARGFSRGRERGCVGGAKNTEAQGGGACRVVAAVAARERAKPPPPLPPSRVLSLAPSLSLASPGHHRRSRLARHLGRPQTAQAALDQAKKGATERARVGGSSSAWALVCLATITPPRRFRRDRASRARPAPARREPSTDAIRGSRLVGAAGARRAGNTHHHLESARSLGVSLCARALGDLPCGLAPRVGSPARGRCCSSAHGGPVPANARPFGLLGFGKTQGAREWR
jgi:hypothetical protein